MSLLENRAIVVLGMHRSGTSAFTGALGLLGVNLGPSLIGASAENEAGYWEHGPVVLAHQRLLAALGSQWDDVRRLPEGWWRGETAAKYRAELKEILIRDFSGGRTWGIKDPRMCRLAPLWKDLLEELGCDVTWVLMTRHAAENVGSLEKRNLFSREKSELLWLEHMLGAERETRGCNRVVVTFEEYLADWRAAMAKLERAVGVTWTTPEIAEEQMGQFVDPGKRHHRATGYEGLSEWTRRMHEALKQGAAGDLEGMTGNVREVEREMDAAAALYGPVIRDRGSDVEKEMEVLSVNYEEVMGMLKESQRKYRETKAKVDARGAELKQTRERLRKLERSLGGRLERLLSKLKGERGERRADSKGSAGGVFPKDTDKGADKAEVSIIVTAEKDPAQTGRCLRAILEHTPAGQYEVAVVTAAPQDLAGWENVDVLATEPGETFGAAHNRAAQRAEGKYLVFLRDQSIAEEGWMDALLAPLHSRNDVGMTGMDGGRVAVNGEPEKLGEINEETTREVDYCTAACMAVSKNLFFQVGGFDGFYLPLEEANLGLKMRMTKQKALQVGMNTLMQRGKPMKLDAERHASNRERFLKRWGASVEHTE